MPNLTPFYDTLSWALENTWPMLTLFLVIVIILRLTKAIINKEKLIFYKEFYNLIFILYILLLYYMLLSTEGAVRGINLIPFKEMTRYTIGSKSFMYNVIGNIVLFIPFGYFVSDYLKANKIRHIMIDSILISLSAEIIQYLIGRAFDIDDIILNAVGSLIGFMIYITIIKLKEILPSFLKNNIFYNILATIIIIIIILICSRMWGFI